MRKPTIALLLVLLTSLPPAAASESDRADVTTPPRERKTKRITRSTAKSRGKKRRGKVKKVQVVDPRLLRQLRTRRLLLKLFPDSPKTMRNMVISRESDNRLGNSPRFENILRGDRRYGVRRTAYRCAFRNQNRLLSCVCTGGGSGMMHLRGPRTPSTQSVTICGRAYEPDETSIHCEQPTARLTSLPARLTRFKKLTRLHIAVNRLGDVSLLRRLPGLKQLTIRVGDARSTVAGLEAIGRLSALTDLTLYLRQATPGALRGLRDLKQLRTLTLGGSMGDFSFLTGVATNTLQLASSQIVDLTPLRSMPRVRTLDLAHTSVRDLRPLAGLVSLRRLELSDTSVVDLSPLRKLVNLWTLGLNRTKVRDLTPLYGIRTLWSLSAKRTRVETIAGKPNWPHLMRLELEDTPLRDISGLRNAPALSTAYLDRTRISDVTPLASCTELKTLSLDETPVRSIEPLASLARLRHLSLSGTPVADVRPLLRLKRLGKIDLSGTKKLKPEQIDRLMRSLPCRRELQTY